MKKLLLLFSLFCTTFTTSAQSPKTELYDFLKKLIPDSTGFENVGEWAVGEPKKFPIKWKGDNVTMSDDTSINFYRKGTMNIAIKGQSFLNAGQDAWQIMLKGPRMGYTNFSIISAASDIFHPKFNIDSVFGKKPFKAKLIRACDNKDFAGYYYYELKLPKKDVAYFKLSWLLLNGKTALRIDCYDMFSKYAVKLDCPK